MKQISNTSYLFVIGYPSFERGETMTLQFYEFQICQMPTRNVEFNMPEKWHTITKCQINALSFGHILRLFPLSITLSKKKHLNTFFTFFLENAPILVPHYFTIFLAINYTGFT